MLYTFNKHTIESCYKCWVCGPITPSVFISEIGENVLNWKIVKNCCYCRDLLHCGRGISSQWWWSLNPNKVYVSKMTAIKLPRRYLHLVLRVRLQVFYQIRHRLFELVRLRHGRQHQITPIVTGRPVAGAVAAIGVRLLQTVTVMTAAMLQMILFNWILGHFAKGELVLFDRRMWIDHPGHIVSVLRVDNEAILRHGTMHITV